MLTFNKEGGCFHLGEHLSQVEVHVIHVEKEVPANCKKYAQKLIENLLFTIRSANEMHANNELKISRET